MHSIFICNFTVLKRMESGGFCLLPCFLIVSKWAEFMEVIFLQSHFRFGTLICPGKKPRLSL